jgi:Zn-dependent M28 family amino/carboxypeptidase
VWPSGRGSAATDHTQSVWPVSSWSGSQWVSLGYFSFVAGSAPTIELSNDADGYVIADAVRFTYQGIVADNDTPSFTGVSGTWNEAMGLSGFYGHNYQTNSAGTGTSRACWQLDVPATAVYQVAVWYTADPNRATNAPMWWATRAVRPP